MAPKKAAVAAAEPPSTEAPLEEKEEKKTDAAALRKLATHPPTAIMIRAALTALDSRKGVSSQAIQSYIKQTYPSVDLLRLKSLVRKALKKGIDNGTLVRPANATVTTGATGKFRLAPKKASKAKAENADPNVTKAAKVAKEGAKGEAKKPAAKKKPASKKDKSSEEPKATKRTKSKDDDDEEGSSKVAPLTPAKKPKAKKAEETEEGGDSESVKPKRKTAKAAVKKAEKAQKTGKTAQSKSKPAKADGDAPAKVQGKRGRKAAE